MCVFVFEQGSSKTNLKRELAAKGRFAKDESYRLQQTPSLIDQGASFIP